jgi:hypothetical protein
MHGQDSQCHRNALRRRFHLYDDNLVAMRLAQWHGAHLQLTCTRKCTAKRTPAMYTMAMLLMHASYCCLLVKASGNARRKHAQNFVESSGRLRSYISMSIPAVEVSDCVTHIITITVQTFGMKPSQSSNAKCARHCIEDFACACDMHGDWQANVHHLQQRRPAYTTPEYATKSLCCNGKMLLSTRHNAHTLPGSAQAAPSSPPPLCERVQPCFA